jgi:hypothetical protein
LAPNVELATKRSLTTDEALAIATELGIDFGALGCDLVSAALLLLVLLVPVVTVVGPVLGFMVVAHLG